MYWPHFQIRFTIYLLKTEVYIYICVLMTQHPPLVGEGLLCTVVSQLHSDTPHSLGLLWTSDQPEAETLPDNTTLTRNINVLGGIRNSNPSKPAATDPSLRPCGHWDQKVCVSIYIYIYIYTHTHTHTVPNSQ